jgi:endonuclease/exonuclease/phosphatase family metal-dependent hydrolase
MFSAGPSGGMADAADSKSAEGNLVRVRLSPRALNAATTLPPMTRQLTSILLILVAGACQTGRNYPSLEGPRYAGGPAHEVAGSAPRNPAALRIVSFNVEYGIQVDSAIAVLTSEPALHGADLVLLQEMDEQATRRIADTLGMRYVYYPAVFRFNTHRNLGNAVLSRWPIVEDRKIILPHLARLVGSQRVATAATVRVNQSLVRVYSVHLGTMAGLSPEARRDQLRAVLADASSHNHVVIGGDMNDRGIGQIAYQAGYAWPTRRGPSTTPVGRLDHIFLKGLGTPDTGAAGTVLNVRRASDHLPVWALALLR